MGISRDKERSRREINKKGIYTETRRGPSEKEKQDGSIFIDKEKFRRQK